MLENHCPYGEESLVVADYLAGRLSPANTQAFEAHTFGCERCFLELQQATELGAANERQHTIGEPGQRTRSHYWPSLTIAATVILALGMWMAMPLVDDPEFEPVYRDAGDDAGSGGQLTVTLSVERAGDRVSLHWTQVPGADLYRLHVFTAAGDPVLERQTADTSIELSAAEWQGEPGEFYVQVIALDELRQTIVQSGFETL